jgi:rhamnose utilization protein RhaD (predicted bifunctional aldolase and dehydrogenase)
VQTPPAEFNQLRSLSRWIGSTPSLVQGPGGNTSIKDRDFLWVKSSGTKLMDAETRDIFVSLNRHTGLPSPAHQIQRSSIETKLHLLINAPVVVHVHSTTSLIVGFREDVEELLERFGRTVVVPYRRPGNLLADELVNLVDTSIHDFAILRNHGLLIWGNSVEEAWAQVLRFESEFSKVVVYSQSELDEAKRLLRSGDLNKYLTPDHAVFLDSHRLESIGDLRFESNWMKQMYDQLCIVLAASLHSSNLSWLDSDEVQSLQNWEAEKVRKDSNS